MKIEFCISNSGSREIEFCKVIFWLTETFWHGLLIVEKVIWNKYACSILFKHMVFRLFRKYFETCLLACSILFKHIILILSICSCWDRQQSTRNATVQLACQSISEAGIDSPASPDIKLISGNLKHCTIWDEKYDFREREIPHNKNYFAGTFVCEWNQV